MFDSDRIKDILPAGSGSDADRLCALLGDHVDAFLLERSIETVVDATATSLGRPSPGKKPIERDRLLNQAAFGADRASRDEILATVPSLVPIVDGVAKALLRTGALARPDASP